VIKKAESYFWFYYFWAFLNSWIMYQICVNSFGNIMGKEGYTNDLWNMGVPMCYMMVISHHVQFLMEMKSISYWLAFFSVLSLLTFMPLNVWMNDAIFRNSFYYGTQFSMIYREPILHLVVFITVFITVLPRFIWLTLQNVVWYPEFAKVKSS